MSNEVIKGKTGDGWLVNESSTGDDTSYSVIWDKKTHVTHYRKENLRRTYSCTYKNPTKYMPELPVNPDNLTNKTISGKVYSWTCTNREWRADGVYAYYNECWEITYKVPTYTEDWVYNEKTKQWDYSRSDQ